MQIKCSIEPKDFNIGVAVARFQVHELHEGHKQLLEYINANHKKIIIFLGVPRVQNTKNNPLDFATRKAMVQDAYPNAIILPLQDNRSDIKWSKHIDNEVSNTFGERCNALLYGSRDSFIPHYLGKFTTAEVITDIFYSGTQVRKDVSREIIGSSLFRAGVIHSVYARYPITFPTVDVVAYNEDSTKLLLCKKPDENGYRFIGGYVDTRDETYEGAAKREFTEETGGAEIGDLKYITSMKVRDWRYEGGEDGIMTTLFIGKYTMGRLTPSDDISELAWLNIGDLKDNKIQIMPEHVELMNTLITKLYSTK